MKYLTSVSSTSLLLNTLERRNLGDVCDGVRVQANELYLIIGMGIMILNSVD